MAHAVAQQVLKSGGHALEHATVHFDGAAQHFQLHLFAGVFGGLTHHGVQAFGHCIELDHARTQQVALQLARQTGLDVQLIFHARYLALQIALHGGHVVDRLRQHACQLLYPRETVELQRIEIGAAVLGLLLARLHLGLGLHFHVAQLVAQTLQVGGKLAQESFQLQRPGIQA